MLIDAHYAHAVTFSVRARRCLPVLKVITLDLRMFALAVSI